VELPFDGEVRVITGGRIDGNPCFRRFRGIACEVLDRGREGYNSLRQPGGWLNEAPVSPYRQVTGHDVVNLADVTSPDSSGAVILILYLKRGRRY
jgi:hypothetical protein